ncbi:hypothetical protein ACFLTH_04830 [Bacteroidota bacterium]
MAEHGHDIHYMLIVIILAFFIAVLSLNQVNPDMATGNVVADTYETSGLVKFFQTVDDVLNTPTGMVVQSDVLANTGCEWINIDNQDFQKIKGLTGSEACQVMSYKSCMMTNVEKTTAYFASNDGSCKDFQFRDESNSFGNCADYLKSFNTGCIPEGKDLAENSYTTVFCCS